MPDNVEKKTDITEKAPEKKACPYAKNKSYQQHVTDGRHVVPPLCDCGEAHCKIDERKFVFRFFSTDTDQGRRDEVKAQVGGYQKWIDPETKKSYSIGTQLLYVVDRNKYLENKLKRNSEQIKQVVGGGVDFKKSIAKAKKFGADIADDEDHQGNLEGAEKFYSLPNYVKTI